MIHHEDVPRCSARCLTAAGDNANNAMQNYCCSERGIRQQVANDETDNLSRWVKQRSVARTMLAARNHMRSTLAETYYSVGHQTGNLNELWSGCVLPGLPETVAGCLSAVGLRKG